MKINKNLTRHLGSLPFTEWREFAADILNQPKLTASLIGHLFPRSASYLRKGDRPEVSNLETEMLWAATLCSINIQRLNQFITYRDQIEHHILASEYESAVLRLAELEQDIGVSYWSIETRLATLSLSGDTVALSDYFQKLSAAQRSAPLLVNLTIGFCWLRSSLGGSEEAYLDLVRTVEAELARKAPRDSKYFYFKAAMWSVDPSQFGDFAAILNGEANSPLIDRYITLLRVCGFLVSSENETHYPLVLRVLDILAPIASLEQRKMESFLRSPDQYLGAISTAFDHYASGNHNVAADDLSHRLAKDRSLTAAHLIHSDVLAAIDSDDCITSASPDLRHTICGKFRHLIRRAANYDESLEYLRRITRQFSLSSWSPIVASRVRSEDLMEVPWKTPNANSRLHAIYLPKGDHARLRYSPSCIFDAVALHLDTLPSIYKMEILMRRAEPPDYALIRSAIPDEAYGRYRGAWWALAAGQTEVARVGFGHLRDDLNGNIRVKSRIFYLQLSGLEHSVEFVDESVRYYLENRSVLKSVDLHDFVREYADQDGYDVLRCNPNLAILLHIYDKTYGLTRRREIADTVEDILVHANVNSPLDLAIGAFSNNEARVFFLAEVCTPDNREGSIHLPHQEDVYLERIKICEELAQFDVANEKKYKQESISLRELITVRKLLASYNGAKIYVDADNVRRLFEVVGKEYFDSMRMQARLLPETLELFDRDSKAPTLQLGGNIDYYLLLKPYTAFGELFFSEKRYGLNTSLSVFIRHGIIDGKIKSSMARNGLTLRSAHETIDKLPSDDQLIAQVEKCIRKFTQQIESLIKDMKTTTLQMKSTKNPGGLFDFSVDLSSVLTKHHIILLSQHINEKTTLDDFSTMLLNQYWERTDSSLKAIRQYLRDHLRRKVSAAFDDLLSDVQKSCPSAITVIRNQVVNAKTAWARDLEEIVSWFERGTPFEYEAFVLSRVIQAALEHTRDLYPDVTFQLRQTNNSYSRFKGRCFSPMLTILNILFENIITYSGSTSPEVVLEISEEPGVLSVHLRNSIPIMSDDEKRAKELHLSHVLAELKQPDFYQAVDTEGRSGIRKIKKFITSDLNCGVEITAEYPSNSEFSMKIEIELMELIE